MSDVTLPTGWSLLAPELWISGLIFLLLILDIKLKENSAKTLGAIAWVGLFPVLGILYYQSGLEPQEVLGGMYRIDTLSLFFKTVFSFSAIFAILITRELAKSIEESQGEFYVLILTALLGMFFTASATNFLMLFISLELIAITFYVLSSYLKGSAKSLEAGMKYLILGSLSSALMLYGVALVYGATGSTHFQGIATAVADMGTMSPLLVLGLFMVLSGVLFKAAAVPFQLWAPDVYEGSPIPITAYLSVGSKAAAFIVGLRLLYEVFLPGQDQWTLLIAWLAGITILYGNLGAIPQTNIKRFMGYSSIGHAGYLLIGLAAASPLGATAINYYILGYLFSNMVVFLVITAVYKNTGSDQIADYAGLAKRSPVLAASMFIALLSLAGVPPLAGFFGKFLLFMSALQQGYLWVALVGGAAVVISLYYYLMIVKTMYVDDPSDDTPVIVSPTIRIAIYISLAAIFVLGIWQQPFLERSFAAVQSLF